MRKRKGKRVEGNMDLTNIVILVLALLIIVSFFILDKTQKRLKEIDGFRKIKEPGDHYDDDVIASFGE